MIIFCSTRFGIDDPRRHLSWRLAEVDVTVMTSIKCVDRIHLNGKIKLTYVMWTRHTLPTVGSDCFSEQSISWQFTFFTFKVLPVQPNKKCVGTEAKISCSQYTAFYHPAYHFFKILPPHPHPPPPLRQSRWKFTPKKLISKMTLEHAQLHKRTENTVGIITLKCHLDDKYAGLVILQCGSPG